MDLLKYFPFLLEGAFVTIQLTILSLLIGLAFGLLIALGRMSSNKLLNIICRVYISIFRGTPLLVQLMILYFALPEIGIQFSAFQAAIIGLSLNEGAYLAEIFRAGIQSVPKGQTEGAKSIGMNGYKTFRRIVFPQAIQNILPAIGNNAIILLKNTSLAAVITVGELMNKGELIAASTFRNLEIFTIVAIIYWIIHYPLTLLVEYLEKRGDYNNVKSFKG